MTTIREAMEACLRSEDVVFEEPDPGHFRLGFRMRRAKFDVRIQATDNIITYNIDGSAIVPEARVPEMCEFVVRYNLVSRAGRLDFDLDDRRLAIQMYLLAFDGPPSAAVLGAPLHHGLTELELLYPWLLAIAFDGMSACEGIEGFLEEVRRVGEEDEEEEEADEEEEHDD